MANKQSIKMDSGKVWTVGERVQFWAHTAHKGTGTIREIKVPKHGCVKFYLENIELADEGYGPLDRWPLATGGEYNRYLAGMSGGCLIKLSEK